MVLLLALQFCSKYVFVTDIVQCHSHICEEKVNTVDNRTGNKIFTVFWLWWKDSKDCTTLDKQQYLTSRSQDWRVIEKFINQSDTSYVLKWKSMKPLKKWTIQQSCIQQHEKVFLFHAWCYKKKLLVSMNESTALKHIMNPITA